VNNKEEYIKIPMLNSIDSINLIEGEKFSDYNVIYFNNINNFNSTKKFYAYKIKDDTMEPKICKKDIVIFEKTEKFGDSDICVVKIANEEAIVRRIIKSKGHIFLEPLNREFNLTVYKEDELNKVIRIIGKVVTLIRSF